MKMRKVVSILLVAAMTIGMVTGCGSSSDKKKLQSPMQKEKCIT
jgi:raffinose/stachyose/melibiose transport system substrate-binding protein